MLWCRSARLVAVGLNPSLLDGAYEKHRGGRAVFCWEWSGTDSKPRPQSIFRNTNIAVSVPLTLFEAPDGFSLCCSMQTEAPEYYTEQVLSRHNYSGTSKSGPMIIQGPKGRNQLNQFLLFTGQYWAHLWGCSVPLVFPHVVQRVHHCFWPQSRNYSDTFSLHLVGSHFYFWNYIQKFCSS